MLAFTKFGGARKLIGVSRKLVGKVADHIDKPADHIGKLAGNSSTLADLTTSVLSYGILCFTRCDTSARRAAKDQVRSTTGGR